MLVLNRPSYLHRITSLNYHKGNFRFLSYVSGHCIQWSLFVRWLWEGELVLSQEPAKQQHPLHAKMPETETTCCSSFVRTNVHLQVG